MTMKLGGRLNAERKKRKITTKTLAEACGISRSYMTLIENNKRMPSAKILPQIAQALDLKTSVVLNWYLEDMKEIVQKKLEQ